MKRRQVYFTTVVFWVAWEASGFDSHTFGTQAERARTLFEIVRTTSESAGAHGGCLSLPLGTHARRTRRAIAADPSWSPPDLMWIGPWIYEGRCVFIAGNRSSYEVPIRKNRFDAGTLPRCEDDRVSPGHSWRGVATASSRSTTNSICY